MIQIIIGSRLFILHFENWKFKVLAVNSSNSLDEILILEILMSLEEDWNKSFKNYVVQKVWLIKKS